MNDNNRKNQIDNRTLKEKWEELQGFHRAAPILLVALAAFITVCYCTADNGVLGKAISTVFMGLFSAGAWAIPVMLLIHAVFYADDLECGRILSRVIFSTVTTVIVSMIEYAITFSSTEPDGNPIVYFVEQRAGGFIGSALAFLMVKAFAWWGLIIIAVAVFAIYVAYFYAGSNSTISRVFFTVLEYIARFLAIIERGVIDLIGRFKDSINEKKQRQIEDKHAELVDDDFFDVDNGMASMEIKELGIKESKNPEQIEQNPTLHSKVHIKSAVKEDITLKKETPIAESIPVKTEAPQRKAFNLDYNFDHLKAEPAPMNKEPVAEPIAEDAKKTNRNAFGLDECAEDVFTKDFDPFDFTTAEKIATRLSSKAPIREKIVPMYGEAVDIDNLTEEDVKRIREKEAMAKKIAEERAFREQRLREFEARKAALIKNSNAQNIPAPAPAPMATEKKGGYSPTFTDYSSHSAKEDIFAVKENKIIERRAAEIASKEENEEQIVKTADVASSETTVTPERNVDASVSSNTSYGGANVSSSAPSFATASGASNNTTYTSTPNNTSSAYYTPISTPAYVPSESNITSAEINEGHSTYKPEPAQSIPHEVAPQDIEEKAESNTTSASYSKTVAFNVYSEVSHNHAEDNSVQMTTQKHNDIANDLEESLCDEDDSLVDFPTDDIEAPEIEEDDIEEDKIDSFNSYNPCYEDKEDEIPEENVLSAERNMIEPDPIAFVKSDSPTSGVTYACERRGSSDSADISATFSLVDELGEDENSTDDVSDDFSWTPECAEPVHLNYNEEDEDVIDGFESTEDEVDEQNDEEIPPEEQNPDVIKQRSEFAFLREEDEKKAEAATSATFVNEEKKTEATTTKVESAPAHSPAPTVSTIVGAPSFIPGKPLPPVPAEPEKKEKKPPVDFSHYQLPGIDLLTDPVIEYHDYTEETQENANKLIQALADFSVTASIKGVDRGPRITRYEVVPARGVTVSNVLKRQDDIALHLAAQSIRMEAPIPGKSAIGVEIPNETSTTVYLKELVDTAEFRNSKYITTICLGKDVAGAPVFSNIESLPHLLVAGATGTGKSVCINACMLSMLFKARPEELKFIMIDPKKVEFGRYKGIPHLLIPIVTENKQAAGALMWAVEEMNRRYELIGQMDVTNIDGYNKVVKGKPELGETLPRIVIVIDEFSDLMQSVRDPVEGLVLSLAQKARAAGIHLIIGTQRPDASVITGTIKSNIPGRISCRVASHIDSKTVLDSSGAEKLLGNGDMLYKSGAIKMSRVQGAYVSDDEMIDVLSFIKDQFDGPSYNEDIMDEITRAAQRCDKKSGGGDSADLGDGKGDRNDSPLNDHEFLSAVEVALSQGQISTALLQRRLSIGFGKAARFIDYMEAMGIVSEKNGAKPRNVLITREEWTEKFYRVSL